MVEHGFKIGRGGKIGNEYADAIGSKLFADCPKTVCAAIAVSALTLGGDHIEHATNRFLSEWWALFDNGIVPQKPPLPRPLSVAELSDEA